MDDLAELKQLYFQECEELLGEVERHLMALDDGSGDGQTVNATFRALHSIKGGAGAFGLQRLVDYSHVFEALLDKMRSNEIPVTPDRVKVLLRAADVLTDLIRSMQSGTELPQDREAEMKSALETLAQGGEVVLDAAARDPASVPKSAAEAMKAAPTAGAPPATPEPVPAAVSHRYRIAFAPRTDMFKRANEPLLLIRELDGLGMTTTEIDLSAVPVLDDIDPEAAYLRWTIELETPAAIEAVRDVFDFASDDCDLEIVDLSPPAPEPTVSEEPVPEVLGGDCRAARGERWGATGRGARPSRGDRGRGRPWRRRPPRRICRRPPRTVPRRRRLRSARSASISTSSTRWSTWWARSSSARPC